MIARTAPLSERPRAAGLTVAILTYRRPDYLATAIQSVLAQKVLPAELLIVDDGSTDSTAELVKGFQESHPSLIRYVWRENGGHSPARNTAVSECRTEYLLWLDDDDALTPDAVESQWSAIQQRPDADVIYGKLLLCDENLAPLTQMPSHRLDGTNTLHLFFKHNPVPNPGAAAKKSLFARVGGYDPTFRHAEDYDLWARAASIGARFHLNETIICHYRSHPGNLATAEKAKRAAHERVWVIERLLARHTIEDIFAHLDWTVTPEQSLARVCFEIAELVCRFGGHDSAVEALLNADGLMERPLLDFLTQLIREAKSRGVDAITALSTHPFYRAELSQRLVSSLLEYHCTDEQRDRFHAELWQEELKRTPLRAIFPTLSWDSDSAHAAAIAHGGAAGYFVMHGAFESALQLLARPDSGISKGEQDTARALLEAACDHHSFEPSRWQNRGGAVISQFLHMLKLRNERYQHTGQTPAVTDAFVARQSAQPFEVKPSETALPDVIRASLPLLREALDLMVATAPTVFRKGDLGRPRAQEVIFRATAPMSTYDVAVIVPTFSRPELVNCAVRSALLQPVERLEVIVVNDAGEALPDSLLAEWRREQRVTYSRHTENAGLGASRNSGIALTNAEYVIVLDDDDELIPGALSLLLDAARRNKSDFVTGDHLRSHYDGVDPRPTHTTYHHRSPNLTELLSFENGIVSGSAIVARTLLTEVGGYREDLHVHEDYNLHLRLAALAEPRYLPLPIMNYHLRSAIGRMNNDRRLYWFATAALNHQCARRLVLEDQAIRHQQREAQFAHVARALREQSPLHLAAMLVGAWLQGLSERGLGAELEAQVTVLSTLCPQLIPAIQQYMKDDKTKAMASAYLTA